jgi:hypothetical protein
MPSSSTEYKGNFGKAPMERHRNKINMLGFLGVLILIGMIVIFSLGV